LACTIALQPFQPIRRWRAQVLDASCQVELLQLSQRPTLDIGKARHAPQPEQGLGAGALERLDRHRQRSNALRY
jgi:hypothetical protein